jgi:hypothetical protein
MPSCGDVMGCSNSSVIISKEGRLNGQISLTAIEHQLLSPIKSINNGIKITTPPQESNASSVDSLLKTK